MLEDILECFEREAADVRTYSPLTLAYIGDGVYELIVRTLLVERGNCSVNRLHHMSVRYVSAPAQARMAEALEETFTEEERAVYRRGCHSKPHTMAKNASPRDYLKATGFEAVLGYLYLCGRTDRALSLVREGVGLTGSDL